MRQLLVSLTFFLSLTSPVVCEWYSRDSPHSIIKELGPKLSKHAGIAVRNDANFLNLTRPWQYWAAPHLLGVVEVKNEQDVVETIRFANEHKIPFIARGRGGHGDIKSLGDAKNALQINLQSLDTISVSGSGTTATFGGAVKVGDLAHELWKNGKQTVHGMCECVGATGVMLGGGHGILQGYHGIMSDQIVKMRVVLANGTAITVSEKEHGDLFWGMQGAGHNFGVVIETESRIYDVDTAKDAWSFESFLFPASADNVRNVYDIAKIQMRKMPLGMAHYGFASVDPGTGEMMILHHIIYHGTLTEIKKWTDPFRDLKPLKIKNEEGTFLDIPRYIDAHSESMACNFASFVPGGGVQRFPVDVEDYNVDALVAAVERMKEIIRTTGIPEANGLFMMIEQYPTHGLAIRDAESSAFPNRKDKLLIAPAIQYPATDPSTSLPLNTTLDELLNAAGKSIRDILIQGAKEQNSSVRAYVNYASGGEPVDEIYGQETWRLEKLRRLKRKYDPQNKFRFYGPIIPASMERVEDGHDEL